MARLLEATHHLAFPGIRGFIDGELCALAEQMELYQAPANTVIFEECSRDAWMAVVDVVARSADAVAASS